MVSNRSAPLQTRIGSSDWFSGFRIDDHAVCFLATTAVSRQFQSRGDLVHRRKGGHIKSVPCTLIGGERNVLLQRLKSFDILRAWFNGHEIIRGTVKESNWPIAHVLIIDVLRVA